MRSGASKRKKRKAQLDEWNRLQSKQPPLDLVFKTSQTTVPSKFTRRQTAQHQDINSTPLHGRDKFRIETLFRIIDTLITECKERTAAYSIVNLHFRFLTEFHDMSVAAVEEESKAFVSVYGSDVDDSFPNEMMHFIEFIGKEKTNAQQMLSIQF